MKKQANNITNEIIYYIYLNSYLILGALLLMMPAIWNGFPLVNADAATYLASGFKPETPFDRPITYGILIRLFSLNGISLWLVIFFQGFLIAWIVLQIVKHFIAEHVSIFYSFTIITILSLFTGLSWLVSQIQPDIFTPIGFLCIYLLFLNKGNRLNKISLYILFFIAVSIHLSHPLLFGGILIILFIFKKYVSKWNSYQNTNNTIFILICLSLSSIIIMGSALSKSKHVYMMGSLLEKGILKPYLNEYCPTKNYEICKYKDELPLRSDDFLWVSNSPLYKMGGFAETKNQFNLIIKDILSKPLYFSLFLKSLIFQFYQQLISFNIGDGNTAFLTGTNLNQQITNYFPKEMQYFNNSKQNNTYLKTQFFVPNIIFNIIVILSLIYFFVIFIFSSNKLQPEITGLIWIIGIGIIFNCLDCAAFSVVVGRYGCKMIWLLPFCALLNLIINNYKKTLHKF